MKNAIDISKYIINYSNENNYGISNLKLQGILYVIQSYFLTSFSKPLFPEDFEAWEIGAIIPEVYNKTRKFSKKNIKEHHNLPEISIEKQKIIKSFVDEFSKFSTVDLFFIIRNQKPWMLTYNPNHIEKINKELMADSSFH